MGLSLPLDPTTEEEELSKSSSKVSENAADQARRIREAEKILLEIAKEYAAKRAAGLVPTKPVPARTLLWEEMERRAQRKMKKMPDGRENTGGVCECCKHGAPWHRLTGGTTAATGSGVTSMSMTREGDALDRSSLFSNGDSFGLPPRLSSTSRHLDKLLGAIAKYRAMGLSEDEIEIKIREDFPPAERLSYGGNTPRRTRSSR
ncbi:hypothetical protein JG688_00005478 [Phytophthora aleatoria]|uniref:Uncharacterized protein n=1 Tax=Phytophthora aleatoria TaxID=2496075 RepID=A0A8J5JCY7_9STRA|nr:hypothetical protein JG688_00005478 [Phytophthora aleatoria]